MDLFTAFAFNQDVEPPIPPEERQYYQDQERKRKNGGGERVDDIFCLRYTFWT